MEYVTDAHALLWHLYQSSRLGSAARQIFLEADSGRNRIRVPAVVIAEVLMVGQKGRLPGASPNHLLPQLRAMAESDNYSLAALLPATVIASHEYTRIPDIFDRLIVAEAILSECPIITRDPVIRGSGLVTTVWDDVSQVG